VRSPPCRGITPALPSVSNLRFFLHLIVPAPPPALPPPYLLPSTPCFLSVIFGVSASDIVFSRPSSDREVFLSPTTPSGRAPPPDSLPPRREFKQGLLRFADGGRQITGNSPLFKGRRSRKARRTSTLATGVFVGFTAAMTVPARPPATPGSGTAGLSHTRRDDPPPSPSFLQSALPRNDQNSDSCNPKGSLTSARATKEPRRRLHASRKAGRARIALRVSRRRIEISRDRRGRRLFATESHGAARPWCVIRRTPCWRHGRLIPPKSRCGLGATARNPRPPICPSSSSRRGDRIIRRRHHRIFIHISTGL
jgi:hypothetical protein